MQYVPQQPPARPGRAAGVGDAGDQFLHRVEEDGEADQGGAQGDPPRGLRAVAAGQDGVEGAAEYQGQRQGGAGGGRGEQADGRGAAGAVPDRLQQQAVRGPVGRPRRLVTAGWRRHARSGPPLGVRPRALALPGAAL